MRNKIHLVKRNPSFSDIKNLNAKFLTGSLSQSKMGGKPIGWDAKCGDEVWVHEVGYGITKKGIITSNKVFCVVPPKDFNGLIALFENPETKIKDEPYWWGLIQKMIKEPTKSLSYVEFEIEYEYLPSPIPCTFMFQGGWYTLKENELAQFEIDKQKSFLTISLENKDIEILKNIPTKIKRDIFNIMRLSKEDKLVVDFDHIIPKYVGGLGCFIENVQPMPKAVNRSKNKSVPLVLFEVAKTYESLNSIIKGFEYSRIRKKDEISQDKDILLYAKRIMDETHQWCPEDQKIFYRKILQLYDSNYYCKLIEAGN